jgi:Rhodopirellula transposase DDE domain
VLRKGYEMAAFCKKTINNILDRSGYHLKKVLKTKPFKKVPETDAIFENIITKHELSKKNDRILRISIDTKAKVKLGNLSRGGYSRLKKAPKADDHDHHCDGKMVPFGVLELNTDNVFLFFGNSSETSDFIVDGLEQWWAQRELMQADFDDFDELMIDLDNGSPVASQTRQFMNRMVEFAKKINKPIQLVYYPPYHSKYNPIERVWASLENYWKPLILDTVANTLQIATQMTWKGMNPIVKLIDKIYLKGITLTDEALHQLSPFIQKSILLPKWDVRILNVPDG